MRAKLYICVYFTHDRCKKLPHVMSDICMSCGSVDVVCGCQLKQNTSTISISFRYSANRRGILYL
jgi:ferredoxin-like protein FixX